MLKDPYRNARIFWFVTMNLVGLAIAGVLFAGMLYADAIDVVFRALVTGLFEYKLVVILIAMSPLAASLLVGMAYAQRALRRKKAAAAAPHDGALTPQGT